jgi:superfamily I DNA/RNA helicase
LNIAQTDHSPLRVIAGPGTGKTFALMRRVARLLHAGNNPESVFLCSFTRTAAADLQKGIGQLMVQGADKVKTGTLHSYCFEVLAKAAVFAVTGRVPRPLLDLETRFLIEDVKGDPFGGVNDCRKRLKAFNSAWARLQHEEPGWCSDSTDRAFSAAILGWLKFHRAMLIGEVVPELLRYLRDNPASPYRGAFSHVLVDEYQDLNRAEQDLLDVLAERARYTVIGDDDQSIYSFKHAHPEGIVDFPNRYTGTRNEEMNECRRCPSRVVEMANAFIAHNTGRSGRVLRVRSENPTGEVHIVQWLSMADEARGVTRFIRKKIESNDVAPGEVLVLAPRRYFGYMIRDELNGKGVPAHSFFTEEIFDGDITKKDGCKAAEAYALLCQLADPEDRASLRVWIGLGHSELRMPLWTALRSHCEACTHSPREALELAEAGQLDLGLGKAALGKLVDRYKLLKERLAPLQALRGPDLFEALFPAAEPWSESLRSLPPKMGGDWDAKQVFEAVLGFISQPELPTDTDYVRVMSLHKSKGLTAKCVIVTGCVEGALPRVDTSLPELEQRRSIEEQRRLLYVAVTRTQNILMLSSQLTLPKSLAYAMGIRITSLKGTDAVVMASRFLAELGPSAPKPILGT